MKRIAGIVLKSGLCLVFSCVAWSQISTSQVQGTVRDSSGAVLPGVEITMTQTGTGIVRTTITNETGGYLLPNLPIGPYRLGASLPGFSTYVQTGIVLQVASNPTLDVTLMVGAVTEQVEVQANALMVETQSTSVGQVIDSQRVVELPLVGRQVTDLITLAGAATVGSDTTLASTRSFPAPTFSIAGGLASGTGYLLDGAMHNDSYNGLNLPLPFPDAMQEFKVETSALPAQYGLHSAAVVNAVTKSGSNQFHGSAFEFVRNYLFNARNFFARERDSLKRNQFGGAVGGPIRKNKMFFFGGVQGTINRQNAVPNTVFIPTAAMRAGDFTALASPACNGGRQISLRAPFGTNGAAPNTVNPALFTTPALNIVSKLPVTNDPCGRITYGAVNISDEYQYIAKIDYQLSDKHSLFGRYLADNITGPAPYELSGGNILTTGANPNNGLDNLAQSFALGGTSILSSAAVNSFRVTLNRTAVRRIGARLFQASDIGANIYSYLPQYLNVNVQGAFTLGGGGDATFATTTGQISEDFSIVKGNHQIAFGGSAARWNSNTFANVFSVGVFAFTGQTTGLSLADFMLGNVGNFNQSAPNRTFMREWYLGLYAQDSWKMSSTLRVNYGVRWEPYFPQEFVFGAYHFDRDAFDAGKHTTVFKNAPNGFFYPGDPGFPGRSGMNKQWNQVAPRVGLVWDPQGSGVTSVRASYGEFFDVLPAQYNLAGTIASPWGGSTSFSGTSFATPYESAGIRNPFPLVVTADSPFSPSGLFNTFSYDHQPTRVQSWNLSAQRQIASNWLVSASYLGTHTIHLIGSKALNPAVFLGLGPCTINGVNYNPCSSTSNTNQRRVLSLKDPTQGSRIGALSLSDDGGTGSYNGLLLSVQRRATNGVSLTGNYTWSHCISDPVNTLPNSGSGGLTYTDPNNRSFDRGNCNTSGTDVRHILNATAIADAPEFSTPWARLILSDWRISATATAQSGRALTVATGIDAALSGVLATVQRPNQVLADVHGKKTISNYLNASAFAQPPPGTLGNHGAGRVTGPGSLLVNASLARLFRVREGQTLEFRAEASNVLNKFNPGNPNLNLNAGNFGTITTALDPRVMQFAVKYIF